MESQHVWMCVYGAVVQIKQAQSFVQNRSQFLLPCCERCHFLFGHSTRGTWPLGLKRAKNVPENGKHWPFLGVVMPLWGGLNSEGPRCFHFTCRTRNRIPVSKKNPHGSRNENRIPLPQRAVTDSQPRR